ncbi:MAG TPA: divalent-cation tolerance protein CutA [Sphingomicrobium sp.]|nr:divalent-cation tolerance protein CutA [Sphingomicrobium sp.]
MTVVSVYATFANAEEAERIGRVLVEERLAACINILAPCQSIYRWRGEIEAADEVPAIMKTSSERVEQLIARLLELHSYDVPAVAVWPIDKLPAAYGEWVERSVRTSPDPLRVS